MKIRKFLEGVFFFFITSLGFCDGKGQLDCYSALIVGFYLQDTADFLNLMQVNSKFGKEQIISKSQQKLIQAAECLKQHFKDKENPDGVEKMDAILAQEVIPVFENDYGKMCKMYRINPIPLTLENYSLFPNIQTQYIFGCEDFIVEGLAYYKVKSVGFKAYKYFKQRFKHLKSEDERLPLVFEAVSVFKDEGRIGHEALILEQIKRLNADEMVKAIILPKSKYPLRSIDYKNKIVAYYEFFNVSQEGYADVFCFLMHANCMFRNMHCGDFYGIKLRTIDKDSFVLSHFQEAFLPALVDVASLTCGQQDAFIRHFEKIWISAVLLDRIIDSDILPSDYKMKFRCYSVKQERAIAERLRCFHLANSKKDYRDDLCKVMRGKTTPEQEQRIKALWESFTEAKRIYKNLLSLHHTSVKPELQTKKEELNQLKQILMENLQGQF